MVAPHFFEAQLRGQGSWAPDQLGFSAAAASALADK
jgi:hypothetical protein